jgi:hypothetical protein
MVFPKFAKNWMYNSPGAPIINKTTKMKATLMSSVVKIFHLITNDLNISYCIHFRCFVAVGAPEELYVQFMANFGKTIRRILITKLPLNSS